MIALPFASWRAALRAHVERRRGLLFALFFALFLVGLAWSFAALGLKPSWTLAACLLLDILVLAPVGVAVAAVTLRSSAALHAKSAPFGDAFAVTALGVIGDLAPMPAGYAARGVFLSKQGLSISEAGASLFASSLAGLALASAAAAFVFTKPPFLGAALALFGVIALAGCAGWAFRRANRRAAMFFLVSKAAGFLMVLVRIEVAMWAIGVDARLGDLALLVFASMAGGIAPIAPGGLGLREGLAAALAAVTGFSPAAAFLAMSLCRISGALSCALMLAAGEGRKSLKRAGNAS